MEHRSSLRIQSSILITVVCAAAAAQDVHDQDLARLLANDGTRRSAVEKIQTSGSAMVPLLLTWASKPPATVDEYGLYLGLADAFGALKSKEAIPFLVKNVNLRRGRFVDLNPWGKTAEVIEETFPAVAALIKIGPDSIRPLIARSREALTVEDRLALIFVVSRISQANDVPEARAFLIYSLGEANRESYWAEEGLKSFEKSNSPRK